MEFYKKVIFLSLVTTILSLGCYRLCYFIAEKYFFDKFFYQKSINHGYWKTNNLLRYGERSMDIISLNSGNYINLSDNNFKIAVIGDSMVWGQGLRNNQRFVKILSDKLNQIKPTNVMSLAMGGDNIFDHYKKYIDSTNVFGKIDLYIFSLFNNDLLLNPDNRYHTNEYIDSQFNNVCQGKTKLIDKYVQKPPIIDTFSRESFNFCIYNKIIDRFPKDNAIYLDIGSLVSQNWPEQNIFIETISSTLSPLSISYKQINQANGYSISQKEFHPNALANQMYADILFNEITTNPRWNFIKK